MSAERPAATRSVVPRLCANCKERPGTLKWVENGGALALVHGSYQVWCEVCVVTAQIEHAEERAAALPELRARLKELRANGD